LAVEKRKSGSFTAAINETQIKAILAVMHTGSRIPTGMMRELIRPLYLAGTSLDAKLIRAGEELYDNYMSFGGDLFFREMVETLREECSGSLGMVEQYQTTKKGSLTASYTRTRLPGQEEL
jgi:hypothetical protein